MAIAADSGIKFTHMDGISTWAPLWYPTTGSALAVARRRERFDISVDEALHLCASLGMHSIVAVGAFDPAELTTDCLTHCFAELCEAANTYRLHVALEFIPFWGIPDLGSAWTIVQSANRANSSILIDT